MVKKILCVLAEYVTDARPKNPYINQLPLLILAMAAERTFAKFAPHYPDLRIYYSLYWCHSSYR